MVCDHLLPWVHMEYDSNRVHIGYQSVNSPCEYISQHTERHVDGPNIGSFPVLFGYVYLAIPYPS